MKRLLLAVALLMATTFTFTVKAQYAPVRQTVKALDSTVILGVSINTLVIRNVTISDSVATVTSALLYRGTSHPGSSAQLMFTDVFALDDNTGLSINAAAALVATKRGVRLH